MIISDPKGRSAIGYNSFLMDVRFNGDYVDNAFNWIGKRCVTSFLNIGISFFSLVMVAFTATFFFFAKWFESIEMLGKIFNIL